MLAHNAYNLQRDTSTQAHNARARRALISKRPSAFQEGDLIAAYLLAITNARQRDPQEFVIHLNGFLSTFRHLRRDRVSLTLSLFLRMAILDLIWHARALDDISFLKFWCDLTTIMGPTTRSQCENYMTEILNGRKHLARLLSIVEVLWTQYSFLKRCLRFAVRNEKSGLDGQNASVRNMIADTKRLLQTLDIPADVRQYEIETGCHDADQYTKWTAWFPCFVYHTSRFVISMLEAESISQGIEAPCDRQVLGQMIKILAGDFERFCPSDWYHPGITVFWMAGLAFPTAEFPESIYHQ